MAKEEKKKDKEAKKSALERLLFLFVSPERSELDKRLEKEIPKQKRGN